jgi:hypothetical protein
MEVRVRNQRDSKPAGTRALRTVLILTAVAGASCASVALASAPSANQIKNLLARELTPPGKGVGIASILKRGGVTYNFKALAAGTAIIEWFDVPPGARLSGKRKPQPVLVASGEASFSAAGTRKMAIALMSPEGSQVLRKGRSVKLTALGNFTTKRGKTVSARKTFVLTR